MSTSALVHKLLSVKESIFQRLEGHQYDHKCFAVVRAAGEPLVNAHATRQAMNL